MTIQRTPDNLFAKPPGAFLRNGSYLYINTSNKYVHPSEKKREGTRGYTGHESMCIGVLKDKKDPECTEFYANTAYLSRLGIGEQLPEPPRLADSIAVGLTDLIGEVSDRSGLTKALTDVFEEKDTRQILDLASYMISKESAVMQHYPGWAREHAIFSKDIMGDTEIGVFLRDSLTIPKIGLFRDKWMAANLGDGRVYLCYDSTNVNSQAKGVAIVQNGHAKDDESLPQVNTDYVVRQSDGLPLTYLHSPGSVTDIAQAQEMISFIERIKKATKKALVICLICDRGYISEKNLRKMDGSELEYILMLRTNFNLYDELADKAMDKIKTYKNLIATDDGNEKYGMTFECTMYDNGPTCHAQVVWSASRYGSGWRGTMDRIGKEREAVRRIVDGSAGKTYDDKELKEILGQVPSYFKLCMEPAEPRKVEKKKPGRGKGTRIVDVPTTKITGYVEDEEGVNREIQKTGIMILVTKKKLTVQETLDAYARRDCVEKVFEALKSHLGMDKIGVTTEEAMHGKGLVWFVASIIHALIFNGTASLRVTDRKHYTVPAMVDKLEAIKGDRDLATGQYKRRYKLTAKQLKILGAWKIDEKHIDQRIGMLAG